jgi:hypothetical protein
MNNQKLITDIVTLISTIAPLPDWNDVEAVVVFGQRLIAGLIRIGYDLRTTAPQAHAECMAMAPADLEAAIMAAIPVGKLGDGVLLAWILKNLPTLISIISLFLKPAPTPVV